MSVFSLAECISAKDMLPIEREQRSAARLIYGIHRYQRISITAVRHELHWLPVVIRIQNKVLVTVFKPYHSGTPQYLEEPKYTGEKFGSRSFCVAGPHFWNRLPAELRELSSLDTLKKHLAFVSKITTQKINSY